MFHKCKNEDEAKKLFRKLSLRLHPDCGGENELMILLQESYDIFILFQESKTEYKFDKSSKKENKIYKNDTRLDIIDEMFEYAKYHENYKDEFLKSVDAFLGARDYITINQYEALVRNYKIFNMEAFLEDLYEKQGKESG